MRLSVRSRLGSIRSLGILELKGNLDRHSGHEID
jgi:hypothetical protein